MENEIIDFISRNNSIVEAQVSFWISYEKYKEDQIEYNQVLSDKNVDLIPVSMSFKTFFDDVNTDVIIVEFGIVKENKVIGNYRYVINYLTEEAVDDYLVFY